MSDSLKNLFSGTNIKTDIQVHIDLLNSSGSLSADACEYAELAVVNAFTHPEAETEIECLAHKLSAGSDLTDVQEELNAERKKIAIDMLRMSDADDSVAIMSKLTEEFANGGYQPHRQRKYREGARYGLAVVVEGLQNNGNALQESVARYEAVLNKALWVQEAMNRVKSGSVWPRMMATDLLQNNRYLEVIIGHHYQHTETVSHTLGDL